MPGDTHPQPPIPTDKPDLRRTSLRSAAYRVADEVLFPAAAEIGRTGEIPASHWQALADAGLYGIAAPEPVGGPGLDFGQVTEILEVLCSGCLSTAFTWIQHHGVVLSLAGTTNSTLRSEFFDDVTAGRLRAGVAYAGVVPTPPRMTATRTDGGWRFDGYAPFVSGWGVIDLLQISARDCETDDVIAAIVRTADLPDAVVPRRLHLAAADATRTVSLTVDGLPVADDAVVSRVALDDFFANQNVGVRLNGTLPFGLLRRATALLDAGGHTAEARHLRGRADTVRDALDASLADADGLLVARADAAQLALDAAAALVAADGGKALLQGADAERLFRECAFILVAASRPQLKGALLQRFSDPRTTG